LYRDKQNADHVQQNMFIGTVLVAHNGKPIFPQSVRFRQHRMEYSEWSGEQVPARLHHQAVHGYRDSALVEAGKLQLDDPISKYYTDSPAAWSKITIRHLLTHTSGIPSYTALPGFFAKDSMFDRTPAEIVKLTQDKPLEFQPGENSTTIPGTSCSAM
jgi:hypothetical protein